MVALSVMRFQDAHRCVMTEAGDKAFCWIRSEEALAERVNVWRNLAFVAIDTEFERRTTFHAIPGLIQIADPEMVYLIDPLELSNLKGLSGLLADARVIKVMHAMGEDVGLLRHCCGVAPSSVFDTQLAAAMLDYGPSLGYQALVEAVLGCTLEKAETNSDWLKRPLSASQIDYAVKDAAYLVELYHSLNQQLLDKQRLDAVLEEGTALVDSNMALWNHPEQAYLKLRGAWDLPRQAQQRLQALVTWRDTLAAEQDKPKPWIFPDQYLLQFAQRPPRSIGELHSVKGLKPKSIRLYGEALLDVLANFEPHDDPGFECVEPPVKGKELIVFKRLKEIVKSVASETGIAPQVLGSRKMLEAWVIHRYRHGGEGFGPEFSNWRAELLNERFERALEEPVESLDV